MKDDTRDGVEEVRAAIILARRKENILQQFPIQINLHLILDKYVVGMKYSKCAVSLVKAYNMC